MGRLRIWRGSQSSVLAPVGLACVNPQLSLDMSCSVNVPPDWGGSAVSTKG
jgi:hypothetical protein